MGEQRGQEQQSKQQGPTGMLADGTLVRGEALAALDGPTRRGALGRYNLRTAGRTFKPGESGNPGGRVAGKVSVTDALRSKLAKRPELVTALVDAWIERALAASGTKDLAMMLDRIDGAVVKASVVESFAHVKRYGFAEPPTPEVRGEDGRTVEATVRSKRPNPEERRRLDANLLAAAEAVQRDSDTPPQLDGPRDRWQRQRLREQRQRRKAPPGGGGTVGSDTPGPPENAEAPPDGTIQGTPSAQAPNSNEDS